MLINFFFCLFFCTASHTSEYFKKIEKLPLNDLQICDNNGKTRVDYALEYYSSSLYINELQSQKKTLTKACKENHPSILPYLQNIDHSSPVASFLFSCLKNVIPAKQKNHTPETKNLILEACQNCNPLVIRYLVNNGYSPLIDIDKEAGTTSLSFLLSAGATINHATYKRFLTTLEEVLDAVMSTYQATHTNMYELLSSHAKMRILLGLHNLNYPIEINKIILNLHEACSQKDPTLDNLFCALQQKTYKAK